MNWDDLKIFLAVARAQGLAGAVSTTGLSAPTLGRRMVALETALGTDLFDRHARGYRLTADGDALFQKVAKLEAEIVPLASSESGRGQRLVKISAGSWMTRALAQNADTILRNQEQTLLRFISAEAVLDIARRETIIGIRNRRPEQRGLACRKIGVVRFAGYASSAAVQKWISVLGNTASSRWLADQMREQTPNFAAEVTAPRTALDLALAGVGKVLLPTFVGDGEAGLQQVTPVINELTHDQWLVTHQDERFAPQVRTVIDRVYEVSRTLHGVKQS